MTDMTAFECQVADEMLRRAGPIRPVDDLAVFEATASRSHRWGFTMFSAVKFVVAGVIVALFGGFLLAGVFTAQQRDEMAPAAVTASPEPEATNEPTEAPTTLVRSDILPGVALTVDEVAPGVLRVLNDGVRDVSANPGSADIVAGLDGSIWVQDERDIVRLGSPAEEWQKWPKDSEHSGFEVAPDGTVWMKDGRMNDKGQFVWRLRSYDGESWTVRLREPAFGWTIAPDGTVWAAYRTEDEEAGPVVARLGADGWEPLEGSGPGRPDGLFVTENGEVWVGVGLGQVPYRDEWGAWQEGERSLWRYREDDGGWQEVTVDAVVGDWPAPVEAGADSTVWFAGVEPRMVDGEFVLDADGYRTPGDAFLTRFDGSGWHQWGPADGVPSLSSDDGWHLWLDLEQAPDGALWMTAGRWHPLKVVGEGIWRFDGSTWQHYLSEHIIRLNKVAVAPDGSVWVLVEGDLYVITPEATTATN